MSNVLQNICQPRSETRNSSLCGLRRRTGTCMLRTCLTRVSQQQSGEWRSLSSWPRARLSAFLHQILLCVLLTLLKENLNEAFHPLPHEPKVLQGMGGTSCLGDSSEHSGQVLPGLHPICQNLPGATLATSLFSLCRGLGTTSRLACWYVPHLLKEELWANYPLSAPTLGYCQLTTPIFTILIRTALSNYKCIYNHFWETVQSNLSGRRLFLQF